MSTDDKASPVEVPVGHVPDKLCIFCKHFNWSKEEMWGMGSTQTGPMFEGGDTRCKKNHYAGLDNYPTDEAEYRAIIIRARKCSDYTLPNAALTGERTENGSGSADKASPG